MEKRCHVEQCKKVQACLGLKKCIYYNILGVLFLVSSALKDFTSTCLLWLCLSVPLAHLDLGSPVPSSIHREVCMVWSQHLYGFIHCALPKNAALSKNMQTFRSWKWVMWSSEIYPLKYIWRIHCKEISCLPSLAINKILNSMAQKGWLRYQCAQNFSVLH